MGFNAYDPGGVGGYFLGGMTNAGTSGRGWRGTVSSSPGLGKYWALVDQLKRTPTDQEWADYQSGGQNQPTGVPGKGASGNFIGWDQQGSGGIWTNKKTGEKSWDPGGGGGGLEASYGAGKGSIPSSGSSSYSAMWGGSYLPTAAQEQQIRTRYAGDVKEGLDVLGTQQAARGMFSGARQIKGGSGGFQEAGKSGAGPQPGDWVPGYGGYKAEQYKTGMDQQMESEIERLRNAAMMGAQGGSSNSGDTGDDSSGLMDALAKLLGGGKGGGKGPGETRNDPGSTDPILRGAVGNEQQVGPGGQKYPPIGPAPAPGAPPDYKSGGGKLSAEAVQMNDYIKKLRADPKYAAQAEEIVRNLRNSGWTVGPGGSLVPPAGAAPAPSVYY